MALPPDSDHYTAPFYNGRMLGAIALYCQLTGDERWTELRTTQGELAAREVGDGHEVVRDRVRDRLVIEGPPGRHHPAPSATAIR